MKLLRCLLTALCFCVAYCACNKPDDGPTQPETPVPSVISFTPASVSADAAGGSFSLAITAPARPKVEIPAAAQSWLSYKDGTFKDYQLTISLTVAANPTYEAREAVVTLSAAGAASQTFTVSQAAKEAPDDPVVPVEPGAAEGLAAFFGLGWNMGNHFDAYYNGSWAGVLEGFPSEEAWGNVKATPTTFEGVKNAGFTSVRIPVSWLNMIGAAPEYKIDETWMNRVYEVAQMAHAAGLKVIVNTHHDENHGVANTYQWLDIKNAVADSERNASIKAEIRAVWTQIALRFADCGDEWLLLEGFNELNDGGWGWSADFRADPTRQCNILNEWNQVFVEAVRATGGYNATRWLGVPTYAANPAFTNYLVLPEDPAGKTAISVHFYDPSDYTIGKAQYSDWGHTGDPARKANGGDENHVLEVFGKLYSQHVAKGVPVYIGEFGCSMRSKSDARAWAFYKYYMEYIVKAARTYNLPCFLWDNGASGAGQEQHGYINHGTGGYVGNSKEIVDILKKAWFTTAEGYTLETVYNSAPKF